MIILPKARWTGQPKYPPRINWAHPATAQLVRAGAATSKRDLVTNAPLTTALIEPGTGGNLISRVGTTWAFSYAAGDEWTVPTNGSLTILAAVPKTRATWGGTWRSGVLSNGSSAFNIQTTTGNAQIRIAGVDVIAPTVGPQAPSLEQVYIAFRASSGAAGEAAVFWNGEQKRTAAHTRALSGATINNVGGQNLVTDGLGDLAAYWVWNRSLSNSELVALTQNPWQLYQPQRFIFPLQSAATAYVLDTTPGTYNITGSPVDLEKATAGQFVLQTTPGAYNITGAPVELIANITQLAGGGPGKTAKRRGWANERARFEESLRTEEVAEQVKAAQRVLKKAQSESAQRLGELVTEYEAARASLDELREQVARIERESRIREEVEVASKVVEIFAREEEEIIAILEIIDEMDSRALLAAVGIAA